MKSPAPGQRQQVVRQVELFARRLAARQIELQPALLEVVVAALDLIVERGQVFGRKRFERGHASGYHSANARGTAPHRHGPHASSAAMSPAADRRVDSPGLLRLRRTCLARLPCQHAASHWSAAPSISRRAAVELPGRVAVSSSRRQNRRAATADAGSGRVVVTIAIEGLRIPAVNVELRNVDGNIVHRADDRATPSAR